MVQRSRLFPGPPNIIPFLFVFSPTLLLQSDSWVAIATLDLGTAAIGRVWFRVPHRLIGLRGFRPMGRFSVAWRGRRPAASMLLIPRTEAARLGARPPGQPRPGWRS